MAKRKGKLDLIEKTLDGEVEGVVAEAMADAPLTETAGETLAAAAPAPTRKKSFKLQFLGREYLEERFPKSLSWADRFAQEWVSEGNFDYLEIPNPRAKEVIVMGLNNIREVEKVVEKKVEETYSEYSEKLAPYSEKLAPLAKRATKRVEKIIQQLRR
ncbi:MAG: hypothetical protein ABIR96_08000 [Bdellovibrionota bacterium]